MPARKANPQTPKTFPRWESTIPTVGMICSHGGNVFGGTEVMKNKSVGRIWFAFLVSSHNIRKFAADFSITLNAMKMKRIFFPVLLASVMLVAMNLASCKNSNKPAAAETSRIGEIPEAAQYIVGIEKYNTAIDTARPRTGSTCPQPSSRTACSTAPLPTV